MAQRDRPYKLRLAMDVTGLSSQTVRHWRQVIPSLKDRGDRPRFSAGDLLAMRVLDFWAHKLGARISAIADVSTALFDLCATESWNQIEHSLLVFDLAQSRWLLVSDGDPINWKQGAVVLPIGKLAMELSERLIGPRAPKQLDMPMVGVVQARATGGQR